MEERYYKNKDTGCILSEKEYTELLCGEYVSFWQDLDEEEQSNFGTLMNYMAHMFQTDADVDFILVDEDGNDYYRYDYNEDYRENE